MSLRVGCDIDGVLADFRSTFFEMAAEVLPNRRKTPTGDLDVLSERDAHKVWKAIQQTPNWWLRVPPYEPQEISRLYRLARERRWEVFFMTARVGTAGDSAQFQTQWWLETQGFHLPSVMTMTGSRGDLAHSLRIDVLIDDQLMNCAEVIAASKSKAVLMLRVPESVSREQAQHAGIGVVDNLAEAIEVLERLDELGPDRRRSLRLTEWLTIRKKPDSPILPLNLREVRPLSDAERPHE
jgi:hypothetical protein